MVGSMVSRAYTVKQYNNSEKLKKELKSFKKQNKMLYIIAKKYGSCRKIKNIKNITEKASNKGRNSSSGSSGDDSDSVTSLARNIR